MNKDEVIALAEKCKLAVLIHSQWTAEIKEFTVVDYVVEGDLGSLMQFSDLVASAERERIKQANAPEIERINAHIKELEDAVKAEREACAKACDVIAQKMDGEGEGPTGNIGWVIDCAEAIRERGQA